MTQDPTNEPQPVEGTVAVAATLEAPAREVLQANLSALGAVHTGSLEATGSAIGFASVAGDATVSLSAAPVVFSKGDVSLRQCYTSAVIAGTNLDMSQGGAPIIIGKKVRVQQGGAMVVASGKAKITNGFVGVLLSPNATVSEDSRVLLGTKAALIVAAALLGGFGIVAVVLAMGVRRAVSWRPGHHARHLPPALAELQERLHKMKGHQYGHRR